MASGTLLANAFANHTSSDSSLKMLGWQDSDGDGVFDVLDVPHSLIGTGYLDGSEDNFHFSGTAEVGRLLNRNSSGFQSDMTINEIDRIEYRIDQGAWVTALTPGGFTASIQFSFAVPVNAGQVEIRSSSFDVGTGLLVAESNRVLFDIGERSIATDTGLAGFVWVDVDSEYGFLCVGDSRSGRSLRSGLVACSAWMMVRMGIGGGVENRCRCFEPSD